MREKAQKPKLKIEFNPMASVRPVDRNLLLWAATLPGHPGNPLEGAPDGFKRLLKGL
jgi:hypothetical protein